MHLSGEHQVSAGARAGLGWRWRGEDIGPSAPESCGKQGGQAFSSLFDNVLWWDLGELLGRSEPQFLVTNGGVNPYI